MSSEPIEAVVFDFGQVLLGWDPRGVWQGQYGAAGTEQLLADLDFAALNSRLDAGAKWADIRAETVQRVGESLAQEMDRYLRDFRLALTGPIAGMAELVADLSTAGARLFGLTNWSSETFHYAEPAAPVIGLMEHVVVSGRVGLAKPDPAIFELLIDETGVVPERTAFIDDSSANVAAACALGLRGEVFVSAGQWRQTLQSWGVPI